VFTAVASLPERCFLSLQRRRFYTSPVLQGFGRNNTSLCKKIKKILKVDYPRGRAKGYYANFISAQKLKIEFSLFHPTVIQQNAE